MEDGDTGDAATKSAPSRAARGDGRQPRRTEVSGGGLPPFCRSRHFVRGSNVYVVPLWDLPANARSWLPEELQGGGATGTVDSSEPAENAEGGADVMASWSSGVLGDGAQPQQAHDSDAESVGSESEASEVGWDGPLGSETRNWSRAAVNGALVLIRRMASAKGRVAASTPAAAAEGAAAAASSAPGIAEDAAATKTAYGLALSAALFPPESLRGGSDTLLDRRLAQVLKAREPKWAVCTLRSGSFAGAVFHGAEAICHKAIHRYTIRAKSGGAQSAMDSTGKKPKSAGAQLRRHGEQRLREEIQELLTKKWAAELAACELVFVSVSPRMRATLLGSEGSYYVPPAKVRRLPFMVGKPTFDTVKEAYQKLVGVIFAEDAIAEQLAAPFRQAVQKAEREAAQAEVPEKDREKEKKTKEKQKGNKANGCNDEAEKGKKEEKEEEDKEKEGAKKQGKQKANKQGQEEAEEGGEQEDAAEDLEDDDEDEEGGQQPGLTAEQLEERRRKKEKEKEKRRKQREKQKEKEKAKKAKAREEEEERKRKEEEELKALEAARIKCDSCKKPITSKPFSRLEFYYCSTECVNAHRRQLQADAAMRRFGTAA